MIRTIDIRLNAAHPELPLPEATTYQNAPSTAFLRGVPKSCGLWQITAVSVAVTFPDNSTTTRAAVLSAGGVWVATIPACATSGRTTSGLRILADGTDENGDAVTGYVLGVADLAVATFDIAPAPGETSYALRYFDNVPNPPHKGDVATVDGTLKYYDGTAWQPFAGVPPPSTSAPLMDGTASAGTSAAYARGDHRHPTDTTRASKEDATLAERGFSAWTVVAEYETVLEWGDYEGTMGWLPKYNGNVVGIPKGDETSTTLSWSISTNPPEAGYNITATRTALAGYQLGAQTTKPLASEAEAEALRTGKQDALSQTQLANIAAVPDKADASDLRYTLPETVTAISTASSEVVSGETVYYGAATLADRTQNQVAVLVALDELRVTIPPAVSGKVRDFGLVVAVGLGEGTALAAPALVPVASSGETIAMMNADGEMPTLADGTTTASGFTALYFTEIWNGTFLVKGEQIQGVA